jgi:hypothetical protein
MDEQMNEQMDEQMNEQMDEQYIKMPQKKSYKISDLTTKSLDDLKTLARMRNITLSVKGKAKNKKTLITEIINNN